MAIPSIQALPSEAARLLDAASLVAGPLSLVKELVDNAVDARATAIEVRMTANTVSKIEVRDDGHGILRADFALLGRPGHTSKLARWDELGTRVADAASLGFRGQGLSAATSLGYVAVTTRTRDEPVAAMFQPDHGGGGMLASTLKAAAAPVGTTVSATCLFSEMPIRRHAAEQNAAKTMAAVKALLCGYAVARPALRLTFRTLQQKQVSSAAWLYHCRRLASEPVDCATAMRESARVLFGNDVARECEAVVASIDNIFSVGNSSSQPTMECTVARASHNFDGMRTLVFEVFLPQPGADLSKLAAGGFVSVDGRPLSAHHRGGIAAKLLAVFRRRLVGAVWAALPLQQRHVRDAYVRLNLQLSSGQLRRQRRAGQDGRAIC